MIFSNPLISKNNVDLTVRTLSRKSKENASLMRIYLRIWVIGCPRGGIMRKCQEGYRAGERANAKTLGRGGGINLGQERRWEENNRMEGAKAKRED